MIICVWPICSWACLSSPWAFFNDNCTLCNLSRYIDSSISGWNFQEHPSSGCLLHPWQYSEFNPVAVRRCIDRKAHSTENPFLATVVSPSDTQKAKRMPWRTCIYTVYGTHIYSTQFSKLIHFELEHFGQRCLGARVDKVRFSFSAEKLPVAAPNGWEPMNRNKAFISLPPNDRDRQWISSVLTVAILINKP